MKVVKEMFWSELSYFHIMQKALGFKAFVILKWTGWRRSSGREGISVTSFHSSSIYCPSFLQYLFGFLLWTFPWILSCHADDKIHSIDFFLLWDKSDLYLLVFSHMKLHPALLFVPVFVFFKLKCDHTVPVVAFTVSYNLLFRFSSGFCYWLAKFIHWFARFHICSHKGSSRGEMITSLLLQTHATSSLGPCLDVMWAGKDKDHRNAFQTFQPNSGAHPSTVRLN